MLLKRFAALFVVVLCCWGCERTGNQQRVGDLVTRQKEHAQQISQMSTKIDHLDEKLAGVERSVNALLAAGVGAEGAEGTALVVASNFASTEEYKGIMRQITNIQEHLAVAQGEFMAFRGEQEKAKERQALRDPGAAWRAMGQPEELSRRLDLLGNNFSGKIDDPATRNQFINDIENLKSRYSAQLSPDQKLEEARALLTEAINATSNDRFKSMMEGQLRSLDEADPENLGERVDRIVQMQKMREIGELTRRYNIPGDTVRDSGLVSFGGRGGMPGLSSGRRGGGSGARPGRGR